MKVIFPPESFEDWSSNFRCTVFLAGSIEMGKADNWQERAAEALGEADVLLLNPRRKDWDSTWSNVPDNPRFLEQVKWEQDGLDRADVIALYFDPGTKSPITLLEFGEYAKSGKLIVCCPVGFWKKGNVDILCRENGIPETDDISEFFELLKSAVEK